MDDITSSPIMLGVSLTLANGSELGVPLTLTIGSEVFIGVIATGESNIGVADPNFLLWDSCLSFVMRAKEAAVIKSCQNWCGVCLTAWSLAGCWYSDSIVSARRHACTGEFVHFFATCRGTGLLHIK